MLIGRESIQQPQELDTTVAKTADASADQNLVVASSPDPPVKPNFMIISDQTAHEIEVQFVMRDDDTVSNLIFNRSQ